jgi:hypothetical protein
MASTGLGIRNLYGCAARCIDGNINGNITVRHFGRILLTGAGGILSLKIGRIARTRSHSVANKIMLCFC